MSDLEDGALAMLAARDQLGAAAVAEIRRRRRAPGAAPDTTAEVAWLRAKLRTAHRELARRHRRDEEIAQHLPAIAARLQSLAADAMLDLRAPAEPERWDKDPSIDWTGIEGAPR